MRTTTIRDLLDRCVDTGDCQLYLVRDGERVLYVGHSTKIIARMRGHIADSRNAWGSLFGKAIVQQKPHSYDWTVELYAVDECLELVKKWFSSSYKGEEIRYAEDALIHEYNPLYNRNTNTGFFVRGKSPFLERLRREKEEEWDKWETEQKEIRERRINAVCDICGQHDTWISIDDMQPCGVKENVHGFRFVCNSCDEVITLIKRLERNPERVNKVRQALDVQANKGQVA